MHNLLKHKPYFCCIKMQHIPNWNYIKRKYLSQIPYEILHKTDKAIKMLLKEDGVLLEIGS
jgi:hypothetical protein